MADTASERDGGADARVFNVGDRVRFKWSDGDSITVEGVVTKLHEDGFVSVIEREDIASYDIHASKLTLIARAPAPEPDAAWALVEMWERPIVVCLCGSTRFSAAFRDANLRETLEGRIVLSIGCDMRSDTEIFGGMPQSELDDIKRRLDDLHKRKIDLADEILVLNVGGYVGESTSSEIAYAKAHGKTIRYLETTGGLPTQPGETPEPASESHDDDQEDH